MKALLRQLARRVWPAGYQAVTRWHHRRWLDKEIASGRYVPVPASDVLRADYERSRDGDRIPRVWHLTWKSNSLPPRFAAVRNTIEKLHPAPPWIHKLWTDASITDFVENHYPEYQKAFAALPRQIMRVDIFRYMVLGVEGGVYCDLDFRMFRPVDAMISDCRLLLPAESDRAGSETFLAQHFLAGAAQHIFWSDLIENALGRPLDVIRNYTDPVMATGPGFVTRVWRAAPERYHAKIPMRVYFSPPSVLAESPQLISPLSFGLHDCAGTWR
ncbi:MAG: glycosyltransferase [Planctomycetota bacterium]